MQEKQHSSCNPEIQNWALEVDVNCLGGPGVGAAAKQESGILVLWQRKKWKSSSWPAWCFSATWPWRTVTWSASLRHALCQTSTDGVQLADLRFHDFLQKTQWLAEIAGQRFWWKGGLRFFFYWISDSCLTPTHDSEFPKLGERRTNVQTERSVRFLWCCWLRVVGICDFSVVGANDVGNQSQLADCDEKIVGMFDFSMKIRWKSCFLWKYVVEACIFIEFLWKSWNSNGNLWKIVFFERTCGENIDFHRNFMEILEISWKCIENAAFS